MERLQIPRFNSTLVQLKECCANCINRVLISFNSTLVQLKEIRQPNRLQSFKRFNSTLVQLKEGVEKKCQLLYKFQFYLSSIKSPAAKIVNRQSKMFQFYLSSIKSYIYFL